MKADHLERPKTKADHLERPKTFSLVFGLPIVIHLFQLRWLDVRASAFQWSCHLNNAWCESWLSIILAHRQQQRVGRSLSPCGRAIAPVARWAGDRSPTPSATGPPPHLGSLQIIIFLHKGPCRPATGRQAPIFEIFPNRHIFLIFFYF